VQLSGLGGETHPARCEFLSTAPRFSSGPELSSSDNRVFFFQSVFRTGMAVAKKEKTAASHP
jgi:hypothetical protein